MTQYLSLPRALTLVAALCFGFSTLSFAEETAPDAASANEAKINQAVENMQRVSVSGPHKVTLGNQAVLNLPEGFTYIPPRQAAEFMRELGNHVDESAFYGLVFNDAISGFVSIEYDNAGYIKDDDAKDWDAAELLSNLIDNSLRYGNETGRITLIVGANPPSLTVEDDGPGIPADERDRVFEAFYRSPTATAGGSGLGLAIVREIAHAHGAWWKLTSRPQFSGTRLSVVFPGPRKGAQLTRQEPTS